MEQDNKNISMYQTCKTRNAKWYAECKNGWSGYERLEVFHWKVPFEQGSEEKEGMSYVMSILAKGTVGAVRWKIQKKKMSCCEQPQAVHKTNTYE